MEGHLRDRNQRRKKRALRVRKHLVGTSIKPRLTVARSNCHIYAQLIDDERGVTLCGIGTMSKELQGTDFAKKSKDAAREIGKRIAAEAKKREITAVVFDRGYCKYHGLIAQLADGAREEGLKL